MNILVWNEYRNEREYEDVKKIYPQGIHNCIKEFLDREEDMNVKTATLDEAECGLSEETLKNTDVLIWWSHHANEEIPDEIARRVQSHVLQGMGFIPLHSAHLCKPLLFLMGTTMCLRWKHGESEKIKCTCPSHPIAEGLEAGFELPQEEMYGEYFDIPKPEDVVFSGCFSNGEVFRSGCTWQRGRGKIFYFQPGHEEYPIYENPNIQKAIKNAVRWAKPVNRLDRPYQCVQVK